MIKSEQMAEVKPEYRGIKTPAEPVTTLLAIVVLLVVVEESVVLLVIILF
jgi:hypothetical protein